jgi:hypothetical protein
VKVASEPNALLAALKNPAYHFKRIGLVAQSTAQVVLDGDGLRLQQLAMGQQHSQFLTA